MARRSDIPPYEIMRQQRARAAAAQAAKASSEAEPEPGESGPSDGGGPAGGPSGCGGGASPWWVGSTVPIVLRVPRGLAALCVVGLLLLLVLSYWVGTARGRAAVEAAYAARQPDGPSAAGPRGVGAVSISRETDPPPLGDGTSDGGDEPGGQVIHTTNLDPRERGLNYFRLVVTSREEGEAIAEFMARARIDTHLHLIDNDRSCIVYAVERGFRGDELNSDARRQHESHLRALGNQWRGMGSGNSSFDTMIPERYQGP